MSDNVAVTAGTGTNIATDERTIAATTVHVQRVTETGSTSGAVGQTTVTNSTTAIVAARDTRKAVILVNRQTVPVYIDVGVSATTSDFRLDPGDTVTVASTAAVNGITSGSYSASGDAKVHYTEVYD